MHQTSRYSVSAQTDTGPTRAPTPVPPYLVLLAAEWADEVKPSLVIIGPEEPLAAGAADVLKEQGIPCFGPTKSLARIESSKAFAKALMDEYFETFGGIRDYLSGIVDEARRTGYTETLLGRRRYLPDLTSDNRQRREMAERMALNAPIQGSAADVIKVAMLNVERAIAAEGLRSRMLLQVHDELVLEVAPGERESLETLVRREMAGAASLTVPLEVSVGSGPSWDAAAH